MLTEKEKDFFLSMRYDLGNIRVADFALTVSAILLRLDDNCSRLERALAECRRQRNGLQARDNFEQIDAFDNELLKILRGEK